MPLRPESMCGISHYNYAPESLLNITRRTKQMRLAFNRGKNPIIVANDTAQIYRHYHLCTIRNGICKFGIIHLERTRSSIDHNHFRSDMTRNACRCCISIS